MSDQTRRTRGLQSGPRSQRVVRSVHEALVAELVRVGFAELSIDAVAREAGVHRTTIYRRWPTKADLVASLLEPQLDRVEKVPETGSVAGDLVALMQQLVDNIGQPEGLAMTRLFTVNEPELVAMATGARDRAQAVFTRAVRRAVDRGELPADADASMLGHLAFAGITQLALLQDEPVTTETLRRLVGVLLRGYVA